MANKSTPIIGGRYEDLQLMTVATGSGAADTYPVSCFVKSFALHDKIDTIGSNGLSSKN